MKHYKFLYILALLALSCGGGSGSNSGSENTNPPVPATQNSYIVLAWNDLGMHCLNPTYDAAVILPPYNTIWAQVIKRDINPQIITDNITVEYRIINNTYSSGKTDSYGGIFAEFWQFVNKLFGTTLDVNTGLNLKDTNIHNGLSGTMVLKDNNHFEADGVPVVPVDDSNNWNPYQVAEITVKDSGGNIIARTRATVPTSDEINCAKCHGQLNTFNNILAAHDSKSGTQLVNTKPELCASCHGSPVLGATGPGPSGKYLSEAIHYYHSAVASPPACLNCHPGEVTKCSRSLSHTAADGNCTSCHGSLGEVGNYQHTKRMPWVTEPKCADCHKSGSSPALASVNPATNTTIPGIDTNTVLYRDAQGHGNLYCASCHGSPHAMIPTDQSSDNYQAIQYQNKAVSIGSCAACHSNSKGDGASEFLGQHGGSNPEMFSACNVCHTEVNSANTTLWPHQFNWYNR